MSIKVASDLRVSPPAVFRRFINIRYEQTTKGELMNGRKLLSLQLAAMFFAVAMLAGCGGGGSGGEPGQTPASAPVSTNLETSVPQPTYAVASGEAIAFATFNAARQQCGFGLLAQNARLDTAAAGHGKYLALNNVMSHFQVAGNPGFTGERPFDRAVAAGYGTTQVGEDINFGGTGETADYLTRGLLAAPYHAIGALFGYRDIGLSWVPSFSGAANNLIVEFGLAAGTTLQDAGAVLTYPCEGTTGVRTAMSGEMPNPFPNDLATVWGQPIIVNGVSDLTIRSASLTGPNGSLPIKAIYGGGQANDPNGVCRGAWACVLPAALTANTTYAVTVAGTSGGATFNLAFSFKTRAAGPS